MQPDGTVTAKTSFYLTRLRDIAEIPRPDELAHLANSSVASC